MTIINLVTDKTVDTTTFTDSQISVKLSNVVAGQEYTIVSRFSNYQDLFKILAIVDILRANYAGNIYLYCPYILGARSDRRFQNNQSFDLKIITNILNSCNFKAVAVLDPHSDVLPALINNSEVLFLTHVVEDKDALNNDDLSFTPVFRDARFLPQAGSGAYFEKLKLRLGDNYNNDLILTRIWTKA